MTEYALAAVEIFGQGVLRSEGVVIDVVGNVYGGGRNGGDKHWVDALDRAESQARGSQLVANSTELDASVVEVIEKLEPTIGLEPMTCRLRSERRARHAPTSAGNCLKHRAQVPRLPRRLGRCPHPSPHYSCSNLPARRAGRRFRLESLVVFRHQGLQFLPQT